MIPIKDYYCYSTPTEEELRESQKIAIKKNCVVHLNWYISYSGWYDRYIYKNTDIEQMIYDLKNIVYGI